MSDTQETKVTETLQVADNTQEDKAKVDAAAAAGAETQEQKELQDTDKTKENKEEPKKLDPTARKFAALARERKEFVKEQAQLKAERAELNKLKEAFEIYKKDPIKLLQAAGWTYEQASRFVIEEKVPEEVEKSETEKRIELLEKQLKDKEQAQAEAAQAEKVETFKQDTKRLILSKATEFELLAQDEDPGKLVYDYIYSVYEQTEGQVKLSRDEAMKELEAFLVAKEEETWNKLVKRNKYKDKLKIDSPKEESPSDKKAAPTSNNGAKTLNNDLAATPTPAGRKLTREEALAEAAKKLTSLM